MATGSGTTVLGRQQLATVANAENRFFLRITSAVPSSNLRIGVLYIGLIRSNIRHVWQAFPVYRDNRAVVGIPPSPSTLYQVYADWDIPGVSYSWESF